MSDQNKPSINVTRGKRKRPSSTSNSSTQSSASSTSSSTWSIPSSLIELSDQVADGVYDVWLAGLGALSVVEEQGTKLFRSLVEEGKEWENERREEAVKAFKRVEENVEKQAEAGKKTAMSIDQQVAQQVREGVDTALERLGVPSQRALNDLREHVDELTIKADRLARTMEEQQVERNE